MLTDHGARVLNPLSGDFHALNLTLRHINIQERTFGQTLGNDLAHREQREARRVRKIKMITRNQADGNSRHAKNRCFQGACYSS